MRIRDNSIKLQADFNSIPSLITHVADKTLSELEKEGVFVFPEAVSETQDLSEDQVVLQRVNNTFRTSNVMGFLGCGDEQLVISSRFDEDCSDFFIRYLLNKVMHFPTAIKLETTEAPNQNFFWTLLLLFPRYLKAATRKGLFKTYIRRSYNDTNFRGALDPVRHIRENTPFVGNVAYTQREYSYDNELTELIRHTIELIRGKPYGHQLLAGVKDEVKRITEVTAAYNPLARSEVIRNNVDKPIRHAFYREYRNLQRLCLLILQHQSRSMGAKSGRIYGILFDGAWLWEEYMFSLVSDSFYHPMNKARENQQYLFTGIHGKKGEIFPDFIGKSVQQRIVADAKYKPIGNISGGDYQQLLSYMFRFDARRGFYFFPATAEDIEERLMLNQGVTYEMNEKARTDVCVIKLGLRIPQKVKSYDAFVSEIKRNELALKECLDDAGQVRNAVS